MAESQVGELQDVAIKTDVPTKLECPVCQEVPLPPIYTCHQGHIVCKQCIPKLTKCKVCKVVLTKIRNVPLEALVLKSTFPCKYKGRGCSAVVTGSLLTDHMRICEFGYNFVPCNENYSAGCKGRKIRSELFIDHLRNHHEIKYDKQRNQRKYTFKQVTDNVETGEGINSDYFEFDEKTFLIKWEKEKDFYFAWICVLGATEYEVQTYTAEIWIKSKNSYAPALTWRTVVHTSDKSLAEIKETGCCVCIPEFQVKRFMWNSSSKIRGKFWKYCWRVECVIQYKLAGLQPTDLYHSPDNYPRRLNSGSWFANPSLLHERPLNLDYDEFDLAYDDGM